MSKASLELIENVQPEMTKQVGIPSRYKEVPEKGWASAPAVWIGHHLANNLCQTGNNMWVDMYQMAPSLITVSVLG